MACNILYVDILASNISEVNLLGNQKYYNLQIDISCDKIFINQE